MRHGGQVAHVCTMKRLMLHDEVGSVTADWITLTAGIVLLGLMVAFSIMNSAGYLMSEFDDLNSRFAAIKDQEADSINASAASSESGAESDSSSAGAGSRSGPHANDSAATAASASQNGQQ